MKKSSHSGTDAHLAILNFRNTPTEGVGLSPAQVMFGRRTRTLLPVSRKLLKQDNTLQERYKDNLARKRAKQNQYYNRSAKELPLLKSGEIVLIHPFGRDQTWRKGVVDCQEGIRSYRVKTEEGVSYRRNRKHLRATNEVFEDRSVVCGDNDDHDSAKVLVSKSDEKSVFKSASNINQTVRKC